MTTHVGRTVLLVRVSNTGESVVPTLSKALGDDHLDVRKAAVLSLAQWAATEAADCEALGLALDDGDADVRAYARRALAHSQG